MVSKKVSKKKGSKANAKAVVKKGTVKKTKKPVSKSKKTAKATSKKSTKKPKKRSPRMQYTIVNLVASANLNATLDLYNLAITIPNIEYEPEQFPGAILKLKEPKVSMLLFKNGKTICSGASTENEISLAVYKASKLIHDIQKNVKVQKNADFNVVNLVATANLNTTLDLFKTAMSLDNVEYEPEQFPGAILRIHEPKLTLLLFKNGKLICAGAKREEFLRKGLKKAAELIKTIK
jgi:transcription initiation factor TFIID TATA-box-binding protein